MKQLVLITAFLMAGLVASAQTKVKLDAQGNYVTAKLDSAQISQPTGKTFTDHTGAKYPVYISRHGKLFYNRTSRAGHVYKVYLKEI